MVRVPPIMRVGFRFLIVLSLLYFFCGQCIADFYRYNIDDLARKARSRIEEIDKKIEREKIEEELRKVLSEIRELYEEAEALFNEKKYEEAKELYKKIDRMRSGSSVKELLKKADEFE